MRLSFLIDRFRDEAPFWQFVVWVRQICLVSLTLICSFRKGDLACLETTGGTYSNSDLLGGGNISGSGNTSTSDFLVGDEFDDSSFTQTSCALLVLISTLDVTLVGLAALQQQILCQALPTPYP